MSTVEEPTPIQKYYHNLVANVSSSASTYARTMEDRVYWQKKNDTRFLSAATSASSELRTIVTQVQSVTAERDMYKLLALRLATDIYGLQSYMSYLGHVTGEPYNPVMDDPQHAEYNMLEHGYLASASVQTSIHYLREHIVSTRLILKTNRRAYSHVQALSAALTPDQSLDQVVASITQNTYRDVTSDLITRFDAVDLADQ